MLIYKFRLLLKISNSLEYLQWARHIRKIGFLLLILAIKLMEYIKKVVKFDVIESTTIGA